MIFHFQKKRKKYISKKQKNKSIGRAVHAPFDNIDIDITKSKSK